MIVRETFIQRYIVLPLVSGIATAALVSIVGSTAEAAATQGRICKPSQVVGKGEHRARNASRRMAVVRWQEKALAAFGPNYAKWSRSLGRALTCSYHVRPGVNKTWRCRARSRPCRLDLPATQHRPRLKIKKPSALPPRRRN